MKFADDQLSTSDVRQQTRKANRIGLPLKLGNRNMTQYNGTRNL